MAEGSFAKNRLQNTAFKSWYASEEVLKANGKQNAIF